MMYFSLSGNSTVSLINNRMVGVPQAPEAFKGGSKLWGYSIGVYQVSLYARLHMGWPLKVRGTFQRSPFKFRAAAKSLLFPQFFSVSFRPSIQRREERKEDSRAW